MTKQTSYQKWEASWSICTPHVPQWSKDHPKKQLQNGVATVPRHWDRTGHQLDRAAQVTIFRLRTGHYQLSHLHRLKISHSDECPCGTGPQTPNHTFCSPTPPSTLWDARHGPVQWIPTGSFGERLRHCGRLWTSPYSPDWRSSMAGNANKIDLMHANINVSFTQVVNHQLFPLTTNFVQTMLKLNCFNTLSNFNPVEKSMRKWNNQVLLPFDLVTPSQGQGNWKAVWNGRTRSGYFYNKYYRYEKKCLNKCVPTVQH